MNNSNKKLKHIAAFLLPMLLVLASSSQVPTFISDTELTINIKEDSFPSRSLMEDMAKEKGMSTKADYINSVMASNPEDLRNLTRKEVASLFGKPTLARKDADAQVLQYKTNSCVIDFYFYDDKRLVSYVDMRFKEELYPGSKAKESVSAQEQSKCLNDVVAMNNRQDSKV